MRGRRELNSGLDRETITLWRMAATRICNRLDADLGPGFADAEAARQALETKFRGAFKGRVRPTLVIVAGRPTPTDISEELSNATVGHPPNPVFSVQVILVGWTIWIYYYRS